MIWICNYMFFGPIIKINIPILINGGCGIPEHMVEPLLLGADGVCAGSIFYFTLYAYKDIKNVWP